MRLLLTFIFMNSLALGLFSQNEISRICSEEFDLSAPEKERFLEEFNERFNTNITDFDLLDVRLMRDLCISPDTVTNLLTYKIDKKRVDIHIIMDDNTEKYLDFLIPNSLYSFVPGDRSSFSKIYIFPFALSREPNIACTYRLRIYPYFDDGDSFLFLKTDGSIGIINNKYQFFESIESFMEYNFGSTVNYVEMYKERMQQKSRFTRGGVRVKAKDSVNVIRIGSPDSLKKETIKIKR